MINMSKAGCTALAVLVLLLLLPPLQAHADVPYQGYTRNQLGENVHSINGYVYHSSIDGYDLSTGPFNAPEDIFVAEDDSVYIVDTGNNRVVQLTSDLQPYRIFGDAEGEGMLNEPKGVFVTEDGTVYVADTKNQRIAVFSPEGKLTRQYGKPESPLLGASFSYSPSKLLVDKRGYMFVVSDGNTQGLVQIDPKGNFKGFYGANHVGFSWSRLFVKLVATDEQKAKLAAVQPLEFSNAVQDREGFIYTTTLGTEMNQLKRLSPVGVDTLNPGPRMYGDVAIGGRESIPAFMDVAVDGNGIMTALDLQNSKVYQYDKLGTLLFVFGGLGDQNGLFVTPSSVAQSSAGIVFVADKGRHRIDLFRTTPFAELVHEASKLYVDGRYQEAEQLWQEVLRQNANFDLAYLAIGKSLYKAEKYDEAMQYFQLARSRGDYSDAFREFRKDWIRANFGWISGGLIVLFILLRWVVPRIWRSGIQAWRGRQQSDSREDAGQTMESGAGQ